LNSKFTENSLHEFKLCKWVTLTSWSFSSNSSLAQSIVAVPVLASAVDGCAVSIAHLPRLAAIATVCAALSIAFGGARFFTPDHLTNLLRRAPALSIAIWLSTVGEPVPLALMAVSSTVADILRTAFSAIRSLPFIISLFLARFASAHVLVRGCSAWGIFWPALLAVTRAIARAGTTRAALLTVLIAERRALPGQAPAFALWGFPFKDIAIWIRLVTVAVGAASGPIISFSAPIAVHELPLVLDGWELKLRGQRLNLLCRLRSCDPDV